MSGRWVWLASLRRRAQAAFVPAAYAAERMAALAVYVLEQARQLREAHAETRRFEAEIERLRGVIEREARGRDVGPVLEAAAQIQRNVLWRVNRSRERLDAALEAAGITRRELEIHAWLRGPPRPLSRAAVERAGKALDGALAELRLALKETET